MVRQILFGLLASAFIGKMGNAQTTDRYQLADGQYNFNIRNDVAGLDFILKLKPVTYQLDIKKLQRKLRGSDITQTVHDYQTEKATRIRRTGLIAQEVQQAVLESGFSFTGIRKPDDRGPYSIDYESFVVPMIQAIQDQQMLIRQQQREIDVLKKDMEEVLMELRVKGKKNEPGQP